MVNKIFVTVFSQDFYFVNLAAALYLSQGSLYSANGALPGFSDVPAKIASAFYKVALFPAVN